MRVRTARPSEAVLLGELGYASWERSPIALADAGRTDRPRLRSLFIDFCQNTADRILVAERDGVPAGWGARENADHEISDLWIGPAHQGTGCGTALLEALEAAIRNAGFDRAQLDVLEENRPAFAFYQRCGYTLVEQGERFSVSLGYRTKFRRLAKPLEAKPPVETDRA